jgi:hypothetical protein
MPTLAEQFKDEKKRKAVVADLASLVDREVAKKGGLSGLAIKGSYAVVKAIKPAFIVEVIDGIFDDCVARLEAIYAECVPAGAAGFAARWGGKAGSIADALLGVTDGRAERTRHTTAQKAYFKLRPTAKRNVEEAVPGLGAVLLRHAPL